MKPRRGMLVLVVGLGCFGGDVRGQLPQGRLEMVAPVGMGAGTEGEVRWKGVDLEGAGRMLFSHPGITAGVINGEDPLLKRPVAAGDRFAVKVAGDVPAGVYDVRVVGRYGVSNPLGFAVSKLPVVARENAEGGQRVELGKAVCGVMGKEEEQVFVVPMAAGQEARIVCYGRRLGSRLDGVLEVTGPDGKVVGGNPRGRTTVDPELVFSASLAGDYEVRLFDYTYKGGDGFGYLLEFNAGGAEAGGGTGDGAVAEDAGNDGNAASVQKVGFPVKVSGKFLGAEDRDAFEMEIEGKRRVEVGVRSEEFGEPTDPVVVVERAEVDGEGKEMWKVVVEGDDVDGPGGREVGLLSRDPRVYFDSEEGKVRYRVTVMNRFPVGDEGAEYRLEIGEPTPGFRLVATANLDGADVNKPVPVSPVVRAGGSARIEVFALRLGEFRGAIPLRVEGLPGGVTADAVTIPEGREGAAVVLRAVAGTADWAGVVKVIGEVEVGGAKISSEARFRGGLWAINDKTKEELAVREAGELMVGVLGEKVPQVAIELAEGGVLESSKGAKLEIPVRLVIGGDANLKGNVTVTPVGFEGLKNNVPNVGIALDKKEGVLNVELKDGGGNEFKDGEFVMVLRGEGQFDYTPEEGWKVAAEEEKKAREEAVKVLEEEVKQAVAAKGDVAKALEEAKKKLGEVKEAGAERTAAEGTVKAAEEAVAAGTQAEADLKKRVEEGKKSVQEAGQRVALEVEKAKVKPLKFATYSTPVVVKILRSPIVVTAVDGTAGAGGKGDVVVKVERKFGFNQNVQLTLVAPGEMKGLKLNLPGAVNGENGKDATISVGVAADSGVGELELELVAKGNFNGVNFEERGVVRFVVK